MTSWQLKTPINAIVFDCDGTLSSIEGIDELATKNGSSALVQALTAEAMGKTGINADLYQRRLDLVRPTKADVQALGANYFAHRTPDADTVIQIFKRLQKPVFIISAGLYPAVVNFGKQLHVPAENIFAVAVNFDDTGNFLTHDPHSPLVKNSGKREIVTQIQQQYADVMYVGDGLNDFAVYDLVARFVGYGGAYYHEKIAAGCQYYIRSVGLLPLLPLALTLNEVAMLTASELIAYHQGMELLTNGDVIVR